MARPRTVYTLVEQQPLALPAPALPEEAAAALWRRYRAQVEVEPPSFKTGGEWRLTSQGWAGFLPVTCQIGLLLQPKIALHDLFGMLEVAYDLRGFHVLDGVFAVTSLPALYERLALILARRVLARARQGFYRAYRQQNERITPLRGRIQLAEALRTPAEPALPCTYQEVTTDIDDNRILAWTLYTILRSGLCGPHSLPEVQRAFRLLAAQATLAPMPAAACRGRAYSRLNDDYRAMHALCAFILEHSGPGHQPGDQEMAPFLVDLARLFEQFVARWLATRLGDGYRVASQVRTRVGTAGEVNNAQAGLHFAIDLVVTDAQGRPRWVLDTKYKTPASGPDGADVAQVLAYAQVQGAPEAVLVYPAPLAQPLDVWVNGVRVRTLAYRLDGDLETAGAAFIAALCDDAPSANQ
ncbi:MAG TPA: hypothetical protein VNK95_21940 [Caldilineaceae bacterium]|nr:hypothetical protein [Caldilineaceae bacterium]